MDEELTIEERVEILQDPEVEASLDLDEIILNLVNQNGLQLDAESRLCLQDLNGIVPGKQILHDAAKCQAKREACEAKADAQDEKTRQAKAERAALEA